MAQKRIKRTDQEWFDLIQDCRTSGMKVKAWCKQHNVTAKALYYHIRRLRQEGYAIPQRTMETAPQEKQEVVCLGIPNGISAGGTAVYDSASGSADTASLRLDFHGVLIEVFNHAVQETITNTLRALQSLC